jgi:hypothetical protein
MPMGVVTVDGNIACCSAQMWQLNKSCLVYMGVIRLTIVWRVDGARVDENIAFSQMCQLNKSCLVYYM